MIYPLNVSIIVGVCKIKAFLPCQNGSLTPHTRFPFLVKVNSFRAEKGWLALRAVGILPAMAPWDPSCLAALEARNSGRPTHHASSMSPTTILAAQNAAYNSPAVVSRLYQELLVHS